MTAAYPQVQNVFVRDLNASNKMVVDFSRNESDFPVNKYIQIVKVPKIAGMYTYMTVEEAGRVVDTSLANFVWQDGSVAPEGRDGLESHEFRSFECQRYTFPFVIGNLTVENAAWDIVAHHASIKARQSMVARTQLVVTELTTTGNYAADHVVDVTALTGNSGTWDASTTARQDIKRSLQHGVEKILADTLNGVRADDLVLVISSQLAAKLTQCQEIVDYIKASPDALAQVRGELPGKNTAHGLPSKLYGISLVVEDTYKVSTKKGASTTTRSQVLDDGYAILMARPGSLEGVAGAPTFSTCVLFSYAEQQVYKKVDADNERTMGRVVDIHVPKLVAPASGILFTSVTA